MLGVNKENLLDGQPSHIRFYLASPKDEQVKTYKDGGLSDKMVIMQISTNIKYFCMVLFKLNQQLRLLHAFPLISFNSRRLS